MRTFKYGDGTTGITYETLDELLGAGITYAAEDDNFFYVRPNLSGHFDNSMYKVDKVTGDAELIYFTDFIASYADKAHEISVERLVEAGNKRL